MIILLTSKVEHKPGLIPDRSHRTMSTWKLMSSPRTGHEVTKSVHTDGRSDVPQVFNLTNRSFSSHAPVLWNSLSQVTTKQDWPSHLSSLSTSYSQFHSRLKKFLFTSLTPPNLFLLGATLITGVVKWNHLMPISLLINNTSYFSDTRILQIRAIIETLEGFASNSINACTMLSNAPLKSMNTMSMLKQLAKETI